jgi:hypothetical protein
MCLVQTGLSKREPLKTILDQLSFLLVRRLFGVFSLVPSTLEEHIRLTVWMAAWPSPETATAPWWAGSRLQKTEPSPAKEKAHVRCRA